MMTVEIKVKVKLFGNSLPFLITLYQNFFEKSSRRDMEAEILKNTALFILNHFKTIESYEIDYSL